MSSPASKRRKLTDVAVRQHGQVASSTTTIASQTAETASAELALASGVYKSSLFKLQVDELLEQLRYDHQKQLSRVEKPLRKLKEIIENIPDIPPRSLREAEEQLQKQSGVVIPFPEPRPLPTTKYEFAYARPTSVNVVGSFALKTQTRRARTPNHIDLSVRIPKRLFQEKDHVNYRYFHKRAHYIACLAAGVSDADSSSYFKLGFDYQDGNTLRPVIVIQPGAGADEAYARIKLRIRIICEIEHDTFPVSRTLPHAHNLRHKHHAVDDQGESAALIYNGALRAEATVSAYLKLLHTSANKCAAFRDACLLGQTWLSQRGFDSAIALGGFGNFEWAATIALLLTGGGPNGKPVLSPAYSSYQLFKAVMQFLASRDLTKPLYILPSEKVALPTSEHPTLFDGRNGINILYKMSLSSYRSLRHEAGLAHLMLNDVKHDHFSDLFITRVDDYHCKYDYVFSIRAPLGLDATFSAVQYQWQVYQYLRQALTDRVTLIQMSCAPPTSWGLNQRRSSAMPADSDLFIALLLDQNNVARLVDHGPAPEQREQADAFRRFWGEKSELRRFRDGRIMESLVWTDDEPSCSIIQQITAYILQRHLMPKPRAITPISDLLASNLQNHVDLSTSLDAFKPVLQAFTDLERLLQALDEVPLKLRHLAPCSPYLRYTSVDDGPSPKSPSPVDITIEFEGSTRWPDDLAAIQMTKLAFLLKISEALGSSSEVLSCRVGTENSGNGFTNSCFLDIEHRSRVTFRARIYHSREQILLETQLKERDISGQTRDGLAHALAAHRRDFLHRVRHTLAFKTLCTRYPLLAPTIRLLKRWTQAHLLMPYLREEVLELLAAHIFVTPAPWAPPASAIGGFLRTLHLISRWNWQYEPLIVDLNAELEEADLTAIKTKFEAWRSVDPAMNSVAFFIASNLDRDGVVWTQHAQPPKVVARRLRVLARAAMDLLKKGPIELDVGRIFVSPITDYDFVVHLSNRAIATTPSYPPVYKNLGLAAASQQCPTTSEMLSSFLSELQSSFGQSFLLFHDCHGGQICGGVWNPIASTRAAWSLKVGHTTEPHLAGDEACLTLNKAGILHEIALLGGSLISRIEVNKRV
ncbi:hypothetical protein KEM52_006328 [Ascosphaera acerosa]|nr:hypothetical protein KEM52_006328 [Ascosphaera acerosa]